MIIPAASLHQTSPCIRRRCSRPVKPPGTQIFAACPQAHEQTHNTCNLHLKDRRSGFITNPESCFHHGTRITFNQMAHPMFRQVISAPTGIMQTSPPVMSAVGKFALLFLGPFSRLARLHRLLKGRMSVPPPTIWRDILHVIVDRFHGVLHAFTVLFTLLQKACSGSFDRSCLPTPCTTMTITKALCSKDSILLINIPYLHPTLSILNQPFSVEPPHVRSITDLTPHQNRLPISQHLCLTLIPGTITSRCNSLSNA